jgi:general stress protein YciG
MAQNRNQGGIQQDGGQQQGGQRRQGRGFAGMDEARQREIASKGGKAAHQKGTAHEFTSEEARIAGRKGGEVVSQNREHMAMIGREGGQARGHRNRTNQVASSDYDTHEESGRERGQGNSSDEVSLKLDETVNRQSDRPLATDESRNMGSRGLGEQSRGDDGLRGDGNIGGNIGGQGRFGGQGSR